MNRRLLMIAGAISAFSLVLLGAVFAKVQDRTSNGNTIATATSDPLSNAGNRAPEALTPAVAQQSAPVQTAAADEATTPALNTRISGAQATQIAQKAQPSARVQGQAELVRYGGRLAYEVPFAQGKIYVHADDGRILGNSMARAGAASQPPRASEGRGREQWGDDEHEYRKERHKKHREHEDDDDDGEERENA